jgi:ABC-type dipeptide/oligopeptide/nickel transport system permease component
MVQFLIKRFIGLIFVVLGVTFITFIMGYKAPGDPIAFMLGVHFNHAEYVQLKHYYGLDLPWYQQYVNYLKNLVTLNFGLSYEFKGRAVIDILKDGVPISLELGLWALFLQVVIGVPIGIISALKANSWIDTTNQTIVLFMYAIPSFVLAVFAQAIIVAIDQNTGINWPVSNWGTPWQYTWTDIQFKLVPILVYAAVGIAYFARLTRTTMLEVLRQDYVRTARAKGMRERVVVYKHALRNAMIPLVTVIGVSVGFLVTGAFFIELIFNIPGIANITIASITLRDYPVIQATTVMLAIAVVLANLVSDILYTVVDPRIKLA